MSITDKNPIEQVALLEQIRADTRKRYITLVQAMIRRFCARRKFLRNRQLAMDLQRLGRGYLARRKAQTIRCERAIAVIQRYTRGWLCRLKYKRIQCAALLLQTYGRGLLARRKFAITLDNYKATVIQRYCRGYLARKKFNADKKRIILCQSIIRRFLARRQFRRLKVSFFRVFFFVVFQTGFTELFQSISGRSTNNYTYAKNVQRLGE